ncbi:Hypothetical predicted protein [Podarcis lilfordi]|uniref:Uncharacterized protein n=1 Tax=Podarcis lilfordi TaxID=74358 RepID=A0AA35L302_9SAUR|nr:Hypothetical predicted protein [Podarcis lilfordi]
MSMTTKSFPIICVKDFKHNPGLIDAKIQPKLYVNKPNKPVGANIVKQQVGKSKTKHWHSEARIWQSSHCANDLKATVLGILGYELRIQRDQKRKGKNRAGEDGSRRHVDPAAKKGKVMHGGCNKVAESASSSWILTILETNVPCIGKRKAMASAHHEVVTECIPLNSVRFTSRFGLLVCPLLLISVWSSPAPDFSSEHSQKASCKWWRLYQNEKTIRGAQLCKKHNNLRIILLKTNSAHFFKCIRIKKLAREAILVLDDKPEKE